MKSHIKDWLDPDGLLHIHRFPRVDSTINAPMYTGLYICLRYETGKLSIEDIGDFLYGISHLYSRGKWRTHSLSTIDRFAHDNFTGVVCGLLCCRRHLRKLGYGTKEIDRWLDLIPFYHHNADHPRDFIFYNYVKRPYLFFWAMPIVSIAMIITCYQTAKIRQEKRIIKTDGKILALMRFISTPMPVTAAICNYLIRKRDHKHNDGTVFQWKNWFNVICDYFKDKDHPIRMLAYEYSKIKEEL